MHHFVAAPTVVRLVAMKTIAKTGKLSLHKETLRSISNSELAAVAGATAIVCLNTGLRCLSITDDGGSISMPIFACHIPVLTSGVFDPNGTP
jgi:hypothetical protein